MNIPDLSRLKLLPDVNPFAFRPPHRIALLDAESVEECLEVPQRHVDSVHGKRMDIEFRKAHLFLVGSVLRPDRTVGKVEPLIGVKPSIRPMFFPAMAFLMAV